ncbi:hypothetical protein ACYCFC_06200 [Stutzerimonas sp. NM35]
MSYKEVLDGKKIAISISESEHMQALGLSEVHLVEAMCELARHMLALGATLIYGGDLRARGFTRLLYELASRYRKDSPDKKNRASIINYLPWPSILSFSQEQLEDLRRELAGTAEICLLDINGELSQSPYTADDQSNAHLHWAKSLTQMRVRTTAESTARIALGGKTKNFMGDMPGIAEEIMTSLTTQRPVYLLGGFGGCTREILDAMGIPNNQVASIPTWNGASAFSAFGIESLNNGLSTEENLALATTPYIDQAVILVIRGLLNIKK